MPFWGLLLKKITICGALDFKVTIHHQGQQAAAGGPAEGTTTTKTVGKDIEKMIMKIVFRMCSLIHVEHNNQLNRPSVYFFLIAKVGPFP